MSERDLLSLARVEAMSLVWRWAAAERDASIGAALAAGHSTRQVARHAGLDHSAIVRRARKAANTPTPQEGAQ